MLYKKQLFILVAIFLTASANLSPISYDEKSASSTTVKPTVRRARKIDPMKLNQEIVKNTDFSKMFKDLHRYLSPDEVRIVTTLGLLSGALQVEESMRENLYTLANDLFLSFEATTPQESMTKLNTIEQTINRDKSVVKVLNEMLRYARNDTTLEAVQKDMTEILKEVRIGWQGRVSIWQGFTFANPKNLLNREKIGLAKWKWLVHSRKD